MTMLWLAATGTGALLLVWYGAQRLQQQKRAQQERSQLLAAAHTWGLAPVPGEHNEALRERVHAAARAGGTSDPIETAARALRAQRERRTRQSSSTPRDSLRRTS